MGKVQKINNTKSDTQSSKQAWHFTSFYMHGTAVVQYQGRIETQDVWLQSGKENIWTKKNIYDECYETVQDYALRKSNKNCLQNADGKFNGRHLGDRHLDGRTLTL
jgi:hypothetical protein